MASIKPYRKEIDIIGTLKVQMNKLFQSFYLWINNLMQMNMDYGEGSFFQILM